MSRGLPHPSLLGHSPLPFPQSFALLCWNSCAYSAPVITVCWSAITTIAPGPPGLTAGPLPGDGRTGTGSGPGRPAR